jgi:two-component system osmolarity sensor histidine kinase EnvZ
MTRALVNEINTFIKVYNDEIYDKEKITDLFSVNQDLNISYVENDNFDYEYEERWFSPIDRTLRRELKNKFKYYWFDTLSYKETVDLKIKYQDGVLQFLIPKDRITNSSARLFGLWITLPAFLLIFIAIIFLKNQTRPIISLAKASERFGRGEDVEEFRPSGALEIRQAGYEFDKMRKRITRHLNQRSEMLSGISHDLRTPLTRIKLQLAFIKDKEISKKLSDDVTEMEKMLNEYLQFASTRSIEKTENFNLSELLITTVAKYENKEITTDIPETVYFDGRKNLIKRCFNNLIDNSIKYSKNIFISLEKSSKNILITIDDDGPGIPKNERENVFKPFYKIDKSRSDSKSSVGLGLSIASDIIRSHGGNIKLEDSPSNGLRTKIFLPN